MFIHIYIYIVNVIKQMNDIGHVIHNYIYHDQGKYCDIKLVNGGGGALLDNLPHH